MGDGGEHDADERAVAAAFVRARRSATALTTYPGARPHDLVGAYRIQDAAIGLDGRAIRAWKVGRINPPDDARLGADRLAGPAFAGAIFDGAADPEVPVFAGGFAATEAEFMLHVVAGHRGPAPHDNGAARALIDEVRIGIEIATSPYVGINADGPAVTVSDFGNNGALVLGAPLAGWRDLDLCAIPVRTEIDGETVGEATAAAMLDGPYGAVRFLLNNLAARGVGWADGLWVSSGAVTGVHAIRTGQRTTAYFGNFGSVSCRIRAAEPMSD